MKYIKEYNNNLNKPLFNKLVKSLFDKLLKIVNNIREIDGADNHIVDHKLIF